MDDIAWIVFDGYLFNDFCQVPFRVLWNIGHRFRRSDTARLEIVVIPHATASTTTQPIMLYQRYAMGVNRATAKVVAWPATTPQNAAVPPAFFMKNATTKTPSMLP